MTDQCLYRNCLRLSLYFVCLDAIMIVITTLITVDKPPNDFGSFFVNIVPQKIFSRCIDSAYSEANINLHLSLSSSDNRKVCKKFGSRSDHTNLRA